MEEEYDVDIVENISFRELDAYNTVYLDKMDNGEFHVSKNEVPLLQCKKLSDAREFFNEFEVNHMSESDMIEADHYKEVKSIHKKKKV